MEVGIPRVLTDHINYRVPFEGQASGCHEVSTTTR